MKTLAPTCFLARALCFLLPLLPGAVSGEVVTGYTSRSAFLAALPGPAATVDFEGLGEGSVLPGGSVINGVALHPSTGAAPMKVVGAFGQTTPAGHLALGVNSRDEAFLSGDELVLNLQTPALGFGLYVVASPGDTRPGDFLLQAGATGVTNSVPESLLPDGGEAYFLGLIVTDPDVSSAFSEVTLRSIDPGGLGLFVFNVDDMAYSLPDGEADLRVSKAGPAQADLGSPIEYSILVSNAGPGHAFVVELEDPTPPGFVFLSNTGDLTNAYPAGVTLIPGGDAMAVQSTYLVPQDYDGPVLVTNTVSAGALTPDPNPGMEAARAVTVIDPTGDRDGDRLSNEEEFALGTNPENRDTDGDRMDDGDETVADTDPLDSKSVLAFEAVTAAGGGTRIEWRGGVAATQLLESSSGPDVLAGPWTVILTNVPPTPVNNNALDPNTEDSPQHYRIRVLR